jgi:Alw26I/Eco31I/Esp3I family type II restriction endonuclease
MAREEREWHPKFIQYMDFIINHPNYNGLPITKKADGSWSWFAPKQTKIGKERILWCENKARELGYPIEPGVYANVMREIHPTKWKVCQICGREMSIYYHYPSSNFLKAIKKKFGFEYTEIDHISDIWDDLLKNGVSNNEIASFLIQIGKLDLNVSTSSKDEVIKELESACRNRGKKILCPGAMSNFPDRFDGFHTYNRCCRGFQDKGRSKQNLKSYTKDRRAYEYWSDGNIHAANQFMGSSFFNSISADHIGPISLGFVHDPRYLQPMDGSDNSSKRDRLQLVDIEKIIETEKRTNVYPMSWYSKLIWEYIKKNYSTHKSLISGVYRDALKQNMSNFMYILWYILEHCNKKGEYFLEEALLKPKYNYFQYSYTFNERGEIINKTPRHFTDRNQNETERYKRIAFKSVYYYNDKENRNIKENLTSKEKAMLNNLCQEILSGAPVKQCKKHLTELMEVIQKRIILSIE